MFYSGSSRLNCTVECSECDGIVDKGNTKLDRSYCLDRPVNYPLLNINRLLLLSIEELR